MLTSVWHAKEKNLFRVGMNRWFRRKYFVEKSPNAVINKRDWIRYEDSQLTKYGHEMTRICWQIKVQEGSP